MSTEERLPDGSIRTAIPEPFWLPGWRHSLRTFFRWVPACYKCRVTFSTRAAYDAHFIANHLVAEDTAHAR